MIKDSTFIASLFCFLGFIICPKVHAQHSPPAINFNPRTYVSHKISKKPTVDGNLDEQQWQRANWTKKFLDIEGKAAPEPRYQTRVKMLWDDTYLYVGARLEEPHMWATLKQRDAVIFHDNNFEVFIDPDGDTHQYYELEVNALKTFWDLMLTQPYRNNGKAIDSWDMRGLKIGVNIEGTLNNPADIDSGWTVELAIPWKDLEEASADGQKPGIGDQWRINFSRVEWRLDTKNGKYVKVRGPDTNKPLPEDNWVWSPQGVINMHYPEMWGFIQFAGKAGSNEAKQFKWQPKEDIKWYLRELYYRQYAYKDEQGSFATAPEVLENDKLLKELGLIEQFPSLDLVDIHATSETFEILVRDSESDRQWFIRENGRIWSTALKTKK